MKRLLLLLPLLCTAVAARDPSALGMRVDTIVAGRDTVTGEVTLTINGVTITISEGGDVSIQTAGKISMKAQQIDLQGGSSLVL